MVVRKILESTLVAGATTVSFTDMEIPNSLLRVYCTKSGLFPISQTLSGNSVTVNYKPQDSNVGVALEIVKSGLDIVDDLVTEDSSKALSANQGVVLKGLIDGLSIPDKITDLDDVSISSIQNGQVLAWNDILEKFVNVNQSGGGTNQDYSTTEHIIGKWIDGTTDVYEKTIHTGAMPNTSEKLVPHGISNLDLIISFSAVGKRESSPIYYYPLPYPQTDVHYQIGIYIDPTNIAFDTIYDASGISDSYVTMRYTKTS